MTDNQKQKPARKRGELRAGDRVKLKSLVAIAFGERGKSWRVISLVSLGKAQYVETDEPSYLDNSAYHGRLIARVNLVRVSR